MIDNKQLIKVIKSVINRNTVLPILEDVYLNGSHLEVTDLETTVVLPFESGVDVCIPSDRFIDCLGMMKAPQIKQAEATLAPKMQINYGVTLYEGKRSIKIAGDNPDNFPRSPIDIDHSFVEIGRLSLDATDKIKTALNFASTDDLRPSMTGIYFDGNIVATDAHRLYWEKLEDFDSIVMENFILPAKTAKILLAIGKCEWQVFGAVKYSMKDGRVEYKQVSESVFEPVVKGMDHVAFVNSEGVTVYSRVIDAKYPDYKVVIPQGKGDIQLTSSPDVIRREMKNALKFSNRATHQVNIDLNGTITISSMDVDFGFEYKYVFEKAEAKYKSKMAEGEHFVIAFCGNFIDEIASYIPKGEDITFKLWTPTKATVINGKYLVMPLMMNS